MQKNKTCFFAHWRSNAADAADVQYSSLYAFLYKHRHIHIRFNYWDICMSQLASQLGNPALS